MKKKPKNKYSTNECDRCGEAHSNYSGKIDSFGNEYVICEKTNKTMIINNNGNIRSILFYTEWILQENK